MRVCISLRGKRFRLCHVVQNAKTTNDDESDCDDFKLLSSNACHKVFALLAEEEADEALTRVDRTFLRDNGVQFRVDTSAAGLDRAIEQASKREHTTHGHTHTDTLPSKLGAIEPMVSVIRSNAFQGVRAFRSIFLYTFYFSCFR